MLVTPEQSGFVNLCITEKVSVGVAVHFRSLPRSFNT